MKFPIIFNYLSNNILFHGFFLYFLSAPRQIKKGNNYDNNKPIGLAYIIISTSSGYKNILMNIEFYLSFHLFNPLFFFYLLAKKSITCQTNKQPLPLWPVLHICRPELKQLFLYTGRTLSCFKLTTLFF